MLIEIPRNGLPSNGQSQFRINVALPKQVVPFPIYPGKQVQLKLPGKFLQLALTL